MARQDATGGPRIVRIPSELWRLHMYSERSNGTGPPTERGDDAGHWSRGRPEGRQRIFTDDIFDDHYRRRVAPKDFLWMKFW
jgi:hypothetical protein